MIDLLPNETVVIQWIIFMIAFVTLHFGIFKPTLKILRARRSSTVGEKEAAQSLLKKSEELLNLCEKKIEEARQIGIRKKEEQLQEAIKFKEELLKKNTS